VVADQDFDEITLACPSLQDADDLQAEKERQGYSVHRRAGQGRAVLLIMRRLKPDGPGAGQTRQGATRANGEWES